jgi:hypothetical protein
MPELPLDSISFAVSAFSDRSRLDMDLDDEPVDTKLELAKKETAQPNRIKKKPRNKKRPSIAFAKHPRKVRTSKKK